MVGEGKRAYEFANDALIDEDGDGEAEEADDGEAAARPAEVELEVLAAGVPLLDPPVLVHLHPATHLLFFSFDLLVGDGRRTLCCGGDVFFLLRNAAANLVVRVRPCKGEGATTQERLCLGFYR